jgi:hypothetical protein
MIVRADANQITFFPMGLAYTTELHPPADAINTVVFASHPAGPIEFYFRGDRFRLDSDHDEIGKMPRDPMHTFVCRLSM